MSNSSFFSHLILVGIIVIILPALTYCKSEPSSSILASCYLPHNAAWISVDWTSQPVDKTAIEQLADEVAARRIHYLFPFTTYIREDGFSPSYTYAVEFVSEFRKFNSETHLLAWIGVPLRRDGEIGVDGWTDLAKEEERRNIITFVTELVAEAGFDGVHLNVETVWDNDLDYLLFLDEMRKALKPDQLLSVTGHTWRPDMQQSSATDYRWSSKYYQNVARRVDQLVPMTYDSMAASPDLYQLWLDEQIKGINRSVIGSEVELLLGTSVSREITLTHNPEVENLLNSLSSICESLTALEANHRVKGIAIYAAWEADENDWQVWEDWIVSSHEERNGSPKASP